MTQVPAEPSPATARAENWGTALSCLLSQILQTHICCKQCVALLWAPKLCWCSDKSLPRNGMNLTHSEEERKPPMHQWV